MKKLFLAMIFMVLLLPANPALGESPVYVRHTLTGMTEDVEFTTLNFSLYVKNFGETAIYDLVLGYVPLSIISTEEISLNIGSLAPQGETELSFILVTPMILSEQEFLEQPFFWAGEGLDSTGNFIEFPAISHSDQMGGLQ